MKKQPLYPFFLIALFFLLMNPLPLLPFAPFFAILYRRTPFLNALWISAGCGVILDLLSVGPFGIHALIGMVTTFILYRFRIYFVDKPIGLASYTLLISLTLTTLNRFSYLFIDPSFPFTLKGFATDFLIYPFIDTLYALLCFSYPLILYRFLKKQWFRFHFLKKDSRKEEEESVNDI